MKSIGRLERGARIALSSLLLLPHAVTPATITVEGACRLSDAILAANRDVRVGGCRAGSGADVIRLTGDVELVAADNSDNGLPPIASRITIRGNGFTIRRADGAPDFRILDVLLDAELALENVTVANGSTAARGGGIRALGDLTLSEASVTGNASSATGGGIFAEGIELILSNSTVSGNTGKRGAGIAGYRYTTTTITGSTIADNIARSRGGGLLLHDGSPATISGSTIANNSAASGGGLRATFYSEVTITDSEISGNAARLEGGGVFAHYSNLTLERSRVTGNTAGTDGGGIYGGGGYGYITLRYSTVSGNSATLGGGAFVSLYYGETNIVNTTISGNSAETGGGLFQGTNFYGPAYVRSSTLSQNSAAGAGGIYSSATYSYGVHLVDTIVAGNPGGNCYGNVVDDGGGNFDDDGSCPGAAAIAPGVDFDTRLVDHGGGTPTHALLTGSVAIDVDDECFLVFDQRRFRRDGACDSGAFELGATGFGGSVVGIETERVACRNQTTKQRGAAQVDARSWLCEELGVAASPGDRVRVISLGSAGGDEPVGGRMSGLEPSTRVAVTCINVTQGGKVSFGALGGEWDCQAMGLEVETGDLIRQKARARF